MAKARVKNFVAPQTPKFDEDFFLVFANSSPEPRTVMNAWCHPCSYGQQLAISNTV